MSRANVSRSHNDDYEGFLYDYLGEDENGGLVTVLSALARLGVDPWQEASELATLPEDEALTRFDAMIAKVRDVPALVEERSAIARRLITRLPRRGSRGAGAGRNPSQASAPQGGVSQGGASQGGASQGGASQGLFSGTRGAMVVLVVLAILVLAQLVSFGVTTP